MTKRFLCLCFTTILLFIPILTASALSIDEYNNLSDEQRKWYNEGNEDGFESGYEAGYDECVYGKDGYDSGYEDGYEAGYDECVYGKDGYDSGYEDGIKQGYEDGYAEGEKDARKSILFAFLGIFVFIGISAVIYNFEK